MAALNKKPATLEDDLDREIARLRDLTSTAKAQQLERAAPAMAAANKELYDQLSLLWSGAGLMHGGQGPTFKDGGSTNEFYCVVSRFNHEDPSIAFRHVVQFANGRYTANWHIDNGNAGDEYYEGPAADTEALVEACRAQARNLAGIAINALNLRLGSR